MNLTLRVPHPPAKPRFEATAFPEGAFALSAGPEELGPGQDAGWEARLAVPESAEDGLYATALLVRSRLGEQRVPVRVRVVSPIPIPPFHVTPTALTLRIVDGIPEPASRVVVTSHRDHDLPLSALVRPGAGYAQGCGVLLDEAGLPARAAEWNLPGRGQLSLYVRAHPDAVHEEFGALVLRAEQEEQAVALAIEKVDAAPKGAGLPQPGGLSYFDWLRLLLLLILLLLVLLIRALLRKRWVRYLAYACLLHAAFFLIAVPPGELVAALPDSVQLTLLQAEEQWSGELSPEQQRRLDELGATADAGQAGAKAAGSGMEAPGGGAPELAGDLLQAADAAPAAAAAMQDPRLEEQRPGAPAPETQRAEPAQPVEDRPLSSEPLEVPAPARPAPAPEPRRAPEAGSVAAASAPEFPALTAPLATPERQPAAAAALADPRPAQPAQPAAASRPAESRPTREAPAASDAPLVDAPLVANPVAAPRPATPDAQVPTAPARANASALLDENIEPVVAAPDGADSAHSAQPAQPAAAAAPGQPSTPVNWGAALAQGGRARGGADARVAGGLAFGDGTDVALDAGPLAGGAGSAGAARKTGGANGTGNHPAARGGGAPSASGIGGAGAGRDGLAELGRAGQGDRSAGPRAGRGGLGELDGAGFGSEKFGPGAGAGDGLARGAREDGAGLGDAPLDLGGSGAGAKPGPGAGQGAAEAGAGPGRAHAAGSGLGYAGEGPGAGGLAELGALGGTGGAGGPRPERGAAALDPDLAWRPAFATDPGLRGAFTARETGSRPLWGYPRQAALRLTLGLARHGGDWNSSPTALYHLATAFRERCGLPDAEVSVRQVELDRAESLAECRVVLMTSNEPIPFTPRQERALAAYLKQGGTLWVNDSSASEDERFDTAFRAMLARALPERGLERLPPDHPYFRAAYDLTPGYKGYRIPPGDKYREEHLRGVVYPSADGRGRLALLYTRNDYADGLEIDPRMTAGRMSLTDLTPDEMLEGSLRFGINLLALALGAEAPVFPRPPEGSAEALKLYRYHGPPLRVFDDFVSAGAEAGGKAWRVEEWSNPAAAEPAQAAGEPVLRVRFKGGDKMKAAVGRAVELNLAQARALVLDLHSGLPNGFNVALLLQTGPDWSSFETRPVYVRPGWNRGIRFPLDLDDFKSDKTEWKAYDTPFRPREQVVRVVVLLYNLREDGTVLLKDLRIEK
ncbi:MAG: DUF4159 domain-containing protein [Planctomycetota bacterium]|nr:DUF4159 domain-containing protein [Planctomycetota bacterium]